MALVAPQQPGAGHALDTFDCGNPALNECLIRHARQAHASGSARTYVVGQIDTLDAPERVLKVMGNYPIPVVILARLAVSLADQGRGLGVGMLQEAIRRTLAVADQAGARALLTHPIDESAAHSRGAWAVSRLVSSSASRPKRLAGGVHSDQRLKGSNLETWKNADSLLLSFELPP